MWKTRNMRSLFPLKNKNNYKLCFIYKEIVLVVHVSLVKPSRVQKLDGMYIISRLKVNNRRNTAKTTSTTVLHGLSFQMLQKMLRPERT